MQAAIIAAAQDMREILQKFSDGGKITRIGVRPAMVRFDRVLGAYLSSITVEDGILFKERGDDVSIEGIDDALTRITSAAKEVAEVYAADESNDELRDAVYVLLAELGIEIPEAEDGGV